MIENQKVYVHNPHVKQTAAEIEEDKKRRGYCPHCNLLLPLSGECFCGYQKYKDQ